MLIFMNMAVLRSSSLCMASGGDDEKSSPSSHQIHGKALQAARSETVSALGGLDSSPQGMTETQEKRLAGSKRKGESQEDPQTNSKRGKKLNPRKDSESPLFTLADSNLLTVLSCLPYKDLSNFCAEPARLAATYYFPRSQGTGILR